MTFWIIFGCIVLIILVISCLKTGVLIDYTALGLSIIIKAGSFRFPVIGGGGDKDKPKKKQTGSTQSDLRENKRTAGETVQMVKRYLPLIGEAAGKLKRKVSVEHIFFHLIWGSPDPADAALGYGAANAMLGLIWPAVEYNFQIKKREISIDLDYTQAAPTIDVKALLTMTLSQLIALIVCLGYKVLKMHLGYTREKTDEKAVQI